MNVFRRYNVVTEEELSKISWEKRDGNSGTNDTYSDTNEKSG